MVSPGPSGPDLTPAAGRRRAVVRWLSRAGVLLALVVAISGVLALAGLPSPVLFGALLAGLGYALVTPSVPAIPEAAYTVAQAVLGVAIGVLFDVDTFAALRSEWLPVVGVCLVTLALSVAGGYVLRLHPGISPATAPSP